MIKSNPYRKPEEAWKKNEDGIHLKYPIFHYDPTIPDDPIIKWTIEDVLGDIDFYGWKGNKHDRIVDSLGKVFITKFEKTKGYTFFIIPTEFRSGVYPGKLERIMEVEEVKQIIISGIHNHKSRVKENKKEIIREINLMSSIPMILKKYKDTLNL